MARYQGREVKLNRPFRLSTDQSRTKKFGVYVRNQETGRVNRVTFGARGMRIKKTNPARQRSFLARMGGVLRQVQGQKNLSPAYWSMRAWRRDFTL